MRRHCILSVICAVLLISVPASAATGINNTECFANSGKAGIDACTALTAAIGRDLFRLTSNAKALEELGKHESALVLYRAAAAYFPSERDALQGLIRARANSRAYRVLLDLEPAPDDTSECWTERWMRAFNACRAESAAMPEDARLQERFGDVARSVGNVAEARAAYARSLALVPDNLNLHRKRDALTQLLNGTAPVTADSTPAPVISSAQRSQPPADRPANDTVRQLELLETLRARQLIDDREYTARRESLMAAAFDGSTKNSYDARYRGLTGGRYLAVVIGNDDYASFPQLETAGADARAVSRVLESRYGFEVTTLINADRYRIMTALSELRRNATSDDNILLYYAGHGLLDEQADRGYWLPVDAERANVAQWISTTDIAGIFAGAEARHALVIADSCFAGTLLRAGDATGLETLQRLAKKRSRTVLTSGGLEPVLDDGDGTHSVFALALLDALTDNDSVIEASRLFTTIRDRVVVNADQTPQYAPIQRAGHDGGDFLFVPKTIYQRNGTQ